MNENLKVNSKTDILEFKRKHNLLVENGTIKANVSNIKTLSNDVINNLRCGDVVLKEDTSGKHAYLVSFKSDTGLCLTYCDASCVETQSYDKVEGNWEYNSQELSFINRMEQIVDKDGHLRVNEGDIELLENGFPNGVEITYAKWSLSCTHLQIVIAGKIEINTQMKQYPTRYAYVNLPDWIMDKIFPVSSYFLDSKEVGYIALSSSGVPTQKDRFSIYVNKTNNRLEILSDTAGATPLTLQYTSGFRFAIDLLIDNE